MALVLGSQMLDDAPPDADLELDDAFSSREQINADLLHVVSKDAQRWGIEIRRVEVVEIEPPPDIKAAMESQITAERTRRSAVLQADGLRALWVEARDVKGASATQKDAR
mgnify:CR=1 FL=1